MKAYDLKQLGFQDFPWNVFENGIIKLQKRLSKTMIDVVRGLFTNSHRRRPGQVVVSQPAAERDA